MNRPTRRTILRGLLGGGAVAVGLPVLECFLDGRGLAFADGSSFPRRFGLFFWGNGILPHRWRPSGEGEGEAWALSDQLMPLAPVKDVISVVTGLEVRVPNEIPHFSGACGFLSGVAPLGEEGDNTFAGPSIDQIIAAEIGGETLYRSIEVGAYPGSGLSFTGPHSSNPPETSPHALFERLFGVGFSLPGDDLVVDPRLALRRSVLDAVLEQTTRLRASVGAQDAQRLEQHFDGIRDLEMRLGRMQDNPANLESCALPDVPPADEAIASLSERNRLLCDLLALSLACDQTRVFSNFFTHPVHNFVFPGTDAGQHQLTHDELDPQPQVHDTVLQAMEELRYFIEALRSVPEGDETLLDHCGLLATSDVSLGRTHSLKGIPCITAGSAGGRLRTNQHYHSGTSENASTVMLSLVRAMGIVSPSFGSGESQATEGLGAIEV
ncbi:MAG: DUF1552 domain-containing protein [Myxococcota bacterium]|nr:DUF1552 domain-containing protein [Myxococcota bacterium]